MMRVGVTFPQIEISADPIAVRDYAQAAEGLGYEHLLAYDHVIGADVSERPGWRGPYTVDSLFHEVFVLFGYLAAVTQRIEFVTGILILPQRQTVLVAKQATEVDVLSGGRLRLGIGIGWNQVEYQSLGQSFTNRGKRSAEQIAVLRALFTQKVVNFRGRWHVIESAGLKPLPVQRSIPIWLGGSSDATLQRIAQVGDGWLCNSPLDDRTRGMVDQLRTYTSEAGREASSVGLEGRISIAGTTPDEWVRLFQAWRELGATHLAVNTMGAGFTGAQQHIDAIRRFKEAIGSV